VLRRGIYAFPTAPQFATSIVRAGGVITCVTALKLYGVWTPETRKWHRRRRECRRDDCRPYGPKPPTRIVDPLPVAVLAAARCLPEEEFVAVLDSVLHRRLMTLDQLSRTLAVAPQRVRRLLTRVDRAESGSETLTRLRLRSRNILLEPQVEIEGVGRVDFLIGDRLVIEIDSIEHHTSLENYFKDRRRDRMLIARGYIVLRFTYHDVVHDWDRAVAPIVVGLIRQRRHLRRSPAACHVAA